MSSVPLPESLTSVLARFQSCFTPANFANFSLLVSGFICCLGRHTISRVFQASGAVESGVHHSIAYRFFSRARWCKDALGRALFTTLLPWLPTEIEVPLDDTLKHSSGPHLFGAGMHYDAGTSTYGRGDSGKRQTFFRFGHNWVIVSVYLPLPFNPARGMAIPLLFRLYRSKKRCPEAEYKKRTELAVELLQLLCSWLPKGRRCLVVADSEYACEVVVKALPSNAHFVGPVVMNAALFEPPPAYSGKGRPKLKGARLPTPEELANDASHPWEQRALCVYGKTVTFQLKHIRALWYSVAGTRLLSIVVTRDPTGRIEDRAYLCTDASRSPDEFLVSSSHRWSLECAIRDGKQFMGIEDPQNGWWRKEQNSPLEKKRPGPNPHPVRGKVAVDHTFPLAFLCYGIVIVWYLEHGDPEHDVALARQAAPWYRHKTQPSFADMLARLRREIWLSRLSGYPALKAARKKIVSAIPAWLWAA